MYQSTLSRKLKPAKKAWKALTNQLQAKFRSLKIPKPIKTTNARFLSFCSKRFFLPLKKRFLSNPNSPCFRRGSNRYSHLYYHKYGNVSPIYIDNLYSDPVPERARDMQCFQAEAETSDLERKSKEMVGNEKVILPRRGMEEIYHSVEDAWNAVVAKSPQLRGVDERADEFICKFREDMKMERERSMLEFQEMLKRSA